MKKNGQTKTLTVVVLAVLVMVGLVWAANELPHTASLTVGNADPVVEDIDDLGTVNPSEGDITTVTFNVLVSDTDGNGNLPATIDANFSRNAEATRSDAACGSKTTVTATSSNYTCSINLLYFDDDGEWNVTASVTDLSGSGAVRTETFTYGLLNAFQFVGAAAVNFGSILAGSTDNEATDDPLTLNNTGNSDNTVSEKAFDLHGLSTPSEYFGAGNLSVAIVSPACNNGDTMVNATTVALTSSTLPRGEVSLEGIYFCLETTPDITQISQQTYDSSVNSWLTSTTAT